IGRKNNNKLKEKINRLTKTRHIDTLHNWEVTRVKKKNKKLKKIKKKLKKSQNDTWQLLFTSIK
ncbi:hypothetical protein J8J40_31565, partial [Mycobacterium tuberculosis]|nr:hypothetical protein [Mycobacterium tuberculosis]